MRKTIAARPDIEAGSMGQCVKAMQTELRSNALFLFKLFKLCYNIRPPCFT